MSNFAHIIAKFNKAKILVIGDLILDRYIQGSVSRISPEAPVPVILEEKSFYTPGGSANVANNLSALKAQVSLAGKVGSDADGKILLKELKKKGIDTSGIVVDKNSPTITKTRIMAQHQQVCRIDREDVSASSDRAAHQGLFNFIEKNINKFDAVIVSDYGKGTITPDLINFVRSLALAKKKILTVDPKVEHFSYYKKVTAITPNLEETENAIRNIKITSHAPQNLKINVDRLKTDEDFNLAGNELLKYLDLDSLLITLGEHGMKLFEKGQKPVHIETKVQEVFDVTGAGDTVISVFTLSLTAGASKRQAAELSNFAAGVVVGKMGAATVSQQELLEAVKG